MDTVICVGAGNSQILYLKETKRRGYKLICADRNPESLGYNIADGYVISSTFDYHNTPTLIMKKLVNRENAQSAKILKERYGAIEDMGFVKNLNPQDLHISIKKLLKNKTYYKKIIHKCSNLIDGKGTKQIWKTRDREGIYVYRENEEVIIWNL